MPRHVGWDNFVVMARYVMNQRNTAMVMAPVVGDDGKMSIDVYTDTDNQGCPETRRSTTGVVVLLGGAIVETISQTQPGLLVRRRRNQSSVALTAARFQRFT